MRRIEFVAFRIIIGLLSVIFLGFVGYKVLSWRNPSSPEALLKGADDLSWLNDWIGAKPLYEKAEQLFRAKGQLSQALYARVSQVPANSESSTSVPAQIAEVSRDLSLPEAQQPDTRLRILTILGMLEVNYDSQMARSTWTEVESLALHQHHYLLASRAAGEQGVAAFLLGDIATAKKKVVKAWMVAKFADPAAHIRYASLYGAGLTELHRYNEALGPLDEAIKVANKTPGAAFPTIATTAKIEALSGLGRNQEALTLANDELEKVNSRHLTGHLYELHQTLADIYQRMGNWDQAVGELKLAHKYAEQLSYWRGLTQVNGLLASAYLHRGELREALTAIDAAIEANAHISDELYFVPKDLAIKAQIEERLGNHSAADGLYQKSTDFLDALLSRTPTPTVERQLLADLSEIYSGYFEFLCDQGKLAEGFQQIERARGRIEARALSRHDILMPHAPSAVEQQLSKLNIDLLNADEPASRARILDSIYETELQLDPDSSARYVPASPVNVAQLQSELHPSELFLEYVLDNPHSYVLALTHTSVRRYALASKDEIEKRASDYLTEILQRKADLPLGEALFNDLLGSVPELQEKRDLIVVPDGRLHLLPFSALVQNGQYIVVTHPISVAPSGTVLHILESRATRNAHENLPYVGVAAWTGTVESNTLLASIKRSLRGPERREFVALPESRHEVESIASDLPKPSTILLGDKATKTNFEALPLEKTNVIHLALHGYVDTEMPDRSALVFAPQRGITDDGLLEVRDIRKIHLNASLVTLSACNTGVGPVGEEGVANIVNAFIEAGSESVVSTLWELEDHATAHLMAGFYDQLSHHEVKVEALRKAQLEMLKSGARPYYWAAFVIDGNPHNTIFNSDTTSQRSSR